MSHSRGRCEALLFALVSLASAGGRATAQPDLIDRFSVTVGGSWIEASTEIRLDSPTLGIGTTIDFEDDLDFDDSETVPSLSVELQVARRHRLSASWYDFDRDTSALLRDEIQFGDEVFPVEVRIAGELDLTDYRLGYTYWPIRRDRSALGIVFGLRVLELRAALEVEQLGIFEDREVTGPLPFLGLEFRRRLAERVRGIAQLGVLALEIEDVSGEQYLARLGVEHLTFERVGFGGGISLSRIDVDTEEPDFEGALELDFLEVSIFSRLRW